MGRFERRWRAASRRHWAILAACVALVLGAIWIAVGERPTSGVILLPAPVHLPATDSAVVAAQASVAAAPPVVPRSGVADRIEVCGVGWVKVTADGKVDPTLRERAPALDAAASRLLASLASSDDEFERAALLWLQMLEPSLAAVSAPEQPSGCEGEACAFSAQARTPSAGFLEQLAQRAITTRDPRVYALAFKACRNRQAGSCALLNARRWAQLDADNGDPWLYLLAEAAARRDTAQMEESIHRSGVAARVDMRYFAIPRAIAEHAGSGDAGLQAANALTVLAIGGMAALPFPSIEPMTRRCRGAELGDANRRQRCDAMASALADRSDNMFYAGVGTSMGRQLGWSDLRLDAVRSLSTALEESVPFLDIDPLTWSCKSIATMLKRASRQGVVGETGFAREWIVASGTTLERYAALEPERRRRRAEAFRAAASAALAGASAAEAGASEPVR